MRLKDKAANSEMIIIGDRRIFNFVSAHHAIQLQAIVKHSQHPATSYAAAGSTFTTFSSL